MVDHYKKACKVKNNPSRYVHVPGVIERFGIYPLGTIRDAKIRAENMKNYYNFFFVTDPFYRILSAFRDKFERYDL